MARRPKPSAVERLVNALLLSAVKKSVTSFTVVAEPTDEGATDYHCQVWFEQDGDWHEEMRPPAKLHRSLIEVLLRYAAVEPAPRGERRGRFAVTVADERQFEYELTVRFADPEPPFAAVALLREGTGLLPSGSG